MSRRIVTAAAFTIGLVVSAASAIAAPITGTLNFTGSVLVTQTSVTFLPAAATPANYGVFQVVIPGTGSFTSLVTNPNETGEIHNLDQFTEPGGVDLSAPGPSFIGPNGLDEFMFFTPPLGTNIDITLTKVAAGIYPSAPCSAPAAVGQNCTPNISPAQSIYNLSNVDNGQGGISATASFVINGYVINTTTGEKSVYQGTLSTQFTNQSYQDVLAELSRDGSVSASFSGNLTAVATPEPGTFSLLTGGGIFCLAGLLLRRKSVA